MPRIVKKYDDGTLIEFDQGKIDDWGVHLTCYNIPKHRPRDVDYFLELLEISRKYNADYVYDDYVRIYDHCTEILDSGVLRLIDVIAEKYDMDRIRVNKLFTILYATMIAEENRKNTRLGKRIKRLGIHQLLFEGFSVNQAANFSKGKTWKEIDEECSNRGF